jgi:D-psicose/D-tagatose/L-ribulose 3-epimerase
MQKIGIHLSYWQESWSDPLTPLFKRAKSAGFDVVELPLLAPHQMDFPYLKSELDRAGLLASCGTGLSPETDITSPDPDIRAAGMAHLLACLRGASQLGSPVLGGLTYAPWGVFPEGDWSRRRAQCVDSLKQAAEMAEALSVTLCLEVVNRFEGYLLNTVESGLALIEDVGHSAVKLHLDTFHMNIEEDDLPSAIKLAGEQLGHFHCVANNRKAPGQGHIDWAGVRGALQAIHYQGFLVAESFVNPAGEVGRGLYIWRSLADELDANAGEVARFLREEVACGD